MKLLLIPLLAVLWSPAPASVDELSCDAPASIGEDAATTCKRKCNSQCSGASNKAKCVAECRRACDR